MIIQSYSMYLASIGILNLNNTLLEYLIFKTMLSFTRILLILQSMRKKLNIIIAMDIMV